MKLRRKHIQILIIMIFSTLSTLSAQVTYDLNFQGILADINGKPITNESFDLKVELRYPSVTETLLSFSETTLADENGWFGFNIDEVSRFLAVEKNAKSQVVIRLDIIPNSQTRWIGERTVAGQCSTEQGLRTRARRLEFPREFDRLGRPITVAWH